MFAILPIIEWILLFLLFWNPDRDWRGAFLSATVTGGLILAGFTELLSLFRGLTFFGVVILWSFSLVFSILMYWRLLQQGRRILSLEFISRSKLKISSLILLGGVGFIMATVGVIAVVAPPNTWDSMTYHMSRVVHWMQNQSVAHYPTYNLPQLFHPPFAEFGIMHFQILSGGDRFANLIQWFSAMGSIIGTSLIAKQLGSGERGQVFTAVFCATLPMGILQASSTQNDYAVSFWLVCLTHYVVWGLSEVKPSIHVLLGIGASTGLAVFTKSSGYIYAFPFLMLFFTVELYRRHWQVFRKLSIVVSVFLTINISHYLRNIDLFKTPLGTPDNFTVEYKVEVYSMPTFISNFVKNLSLHSDIIRHLQLQEFVTPLTGKVAKAIELFHGLLGVDLNDPRITDTQYTVPGISLDENTAGNPLQLLLIFIALALALIFISSLKNRQQVLSYAIATIAGFLLLCLLLKIQPYQSRHHLAAFVLFSPVVGFIFEETLNQYLLMAIAALLISMSTPWIFENKFRPIMADSNIFNTARLELYFTNRHHLKAPYFEAVNVIKSTKCQNIGLSLGTGESVGNSYWEYPLWPLLASENVKFNRIQHINPNNVSDQKSDVYPNQNFQSCAIIAVRLDHEKIDQFVINQQVFIPIWSSDPVMVLVAQEIRLDHFESEAELQY